MCSNFPVLRKILADEQWQALAADFFARHQCKTPYFSEIAEEFLDYLQNEWPGDAEFPFLLELAHYEWVEMALAIATDELVLADDAFIQDILQRPLSLSPLAWPLVYQYPVHTIGPGSLPREVPTQPSYLIVYRDAADEVHFMQTTPLTYALLQLIEQQGSLTGAESLDQLALTWSPVIDMARLLAQGLSTLQELAGKGILMPAPVG